MSGNNTDNTRSLARRDIYSQMIIDELYDGFLPEGMARDVSDFPDGTTLYIPTFGEVVIEDVVEDQETPTSSIDTGRITLEIDQHKGAGVDFTDELMEDAYYAEQLEAAAPGKMLHGLKEVYETSMLETGERGQIQGDPNTINEYHHRFVASGANGELTLDDFSYMKVAMRKANVPEEGMICIVDPITELTLNRLTNLVNVSNNPHFEGMVETGFAKNMRFIRNIFGWDVYCSNRLPRIDTETIDASGGVATVGAAAAGGPQTATNAYAAQFMSVADDMVTPYMSAWRRQPKVEYYRDGPRRKDVYYLTARYGFGLQRAQSLGTVLTSIERF